MVNIPERPARPPRIAVIGDLIVDRYTWGDVTRISPEAPIPVLASETSEIRPGGAASVANLLVHLEAEVDLFGVIGDDPEGIALRRLLEEQGINHQHVVATEFRPTTEKHRFVGKAGNRHPHQILRVDREKVGPISLEAMNQLLDGLWDNFDTYDAILFSDYAKGVCTVEILNEVIKSARDAEKPVSVDPGRGQSLDFYRHATLLTPNRQEAGELSGIDIQSPCQAIRAAKAIKDESEAARVLVTLDKDGMVLVDDFGTNIIRTEQRDVYDITGAGDVVLAVMGYGLAVGWTGKETAGVANRAAGLEVQKMGVEPLRWEEINGDEQAESPSQPLPDDAVQFARATKAQGKTVVFTNGCFDLFHAGHLQTLKAASKEGDVLIVAINSDASVKRLKGDSRPIVSEQDRAAILRELDCVDRVIVYEDDTPHRLLKMIRPDLLVKGGTTDEIVGREVVEAYGGSVIRMGEIPGISTTRLLESLTTQQSAH